MFSILNLIHVCDLRKAKRHYCDKLKQSDVWVHCLLLYMDDLNYLVRI